MVRSLPAVTFSFFLLAVLAVSACTTAPPVATRSVAYISDFDLDLAQIQQSGRVPKPLPLSQRLGYGRSGSEPTPEQRARGIVDLMSRSLLNDLRQAGIPAQRLPPGAPLPSSGWLVRGAFVDVDADGRLHRAVEFGAGSTQEVIAAVDQLGSGAPQPLFTTDSTAESGKPPGPVVTPNPNIPLGRFVLTPRDLERNVTGAAEGIADQVKARMEVGASDRSEMR